MLFYFIPMIIILYMLYYCANINNNVTMTKGTALCMFIIALIPVLNACAVIASLVIWLMESDWSNEEFKWPW